MIKKIIIVMLLFVFSMFCFSFAAGQINVGQKMDEKLSQMKEKYSNNPFGVLEFLHWNHAWNSYKYPDEESLRKTISLMKEAGVGCVRVDFLWQDIEPKEHDFNFEKYDLIVTLLREANIEILGILDYCSEWASPYCKWNSPPTENKLFIKFAVKVIKRYKSKVKFWELWNEPDSSIYWNPQDGLKTYCLLLKEFYPAAKEANPECKILNGGFANGISSVNKLYDNGAKDYFDILNIHIFESPFNEGALKRILAYPKLAYKIMQRNGNGNKKIWITEIGCPGVKRGIQAKKWWLGKNPSERKQAEWVKDVFTNLIKSKGVEKVFWAFFRDCDHHWGDGTDYFGLVRWDFSRKPSFKAYKECFEKWESDN